jgi:hypothetical protein
MSAALALFDCLITWAAVINAAGYAWGLYTLVSFYDGLVHVSTTFAIIMTAGFLTHHQLPVRIFAIGRSLSSRSPALA